MTGIAWQRSVKIIALISLIILIAMNFTEPHLVSSEYKSIRKTMLLPDARVVLHRSSPYGQVEVVSSPAQRYAPGLSLNYNKPVPARSMMFNNGNWAGAINGCASVIGATLGIIVSVEAGFGWVLFSAAAVYGVAGLAGKSR